MNRLVYAIYALVVVLVTTSVNGGLSRLGGGTSYRSWGGGSSFSTGSGSSWGGAGHK